MDSDDEFMSGLSSQDDDDFGGAQESDDGSLGDGTCSLCSTTVIKLADFVTSASEFDDEEESDIGFLQDKDLKPTKKTYEVEHKVFSPTDIQLHQDKQIDEVSAILGQPSEASAILLRHLRWNKERLVEAYMEKPDSTLESAGLGPDAAQTPRTKVIKCFTCEICCEDTPGLETYALKCAHRYCTDCYRQYLAQKIKDEGEAARIQCPTRGCHRIVDAKSLDLLVAEELKSRYSDQLQVGDVTNRHADIKCFLRVLTSTTKRT